MSQIRFSDGSLSYIGYGFNGKFHMDIHGGANPTVTIYPKVLRKHRKPLKNIGVYL